MRPGILFLPFLSLFLWSIAIALKSTYSTSPWIYGFVLGLAFLFFSLWLLLDWRGLLRILSRQGMKYGLSSGAAVALGLGIILGLAYISLLPRFNKGWDVTRYKSNTLASQTVSLIGKVAELKEPLVIKAFFAEAEQKKKFLDLLHRYEVSGLIVQKNFIDPETHPAEAIAENITGRNTVILQHGFEQVRLSVFTEEKFSNGILNVLKDVKKKVYFSSGHGEGLIDSQDAEGYASAVLLLKDNKFVVEQMDFTVTGSIPDDASLVIVGGPQYDFRENEVAIYRDYLNNGGAVLLMVDSLVPCRQINAVVASFGLSYDDDLLILRSEDARTRFWGQNNAICSRFDAFHPITSSFAKQSSVTIVAPNSRSIRVIEGLGGSVKPEIILKTAEAVVAIMGVKSKRDLARTGKEQIKEGEFGFAAVAQAPVSSDLVKSDPLLEPSRLEQRLVLIGSSYLANNSGGGRSENLDLFMNAVNFLTRNEDYIAIAPKDRRPTTIDLSSEQSQLSLLVISFIYPFLFLGGGVWYWLRRRKA